MKWLARFVSFVLCFVLVMNVSWAESVDDAVPQNEKMLRQYELGSGLRGALKFAVTGENGLALLLSPLNDTEFQVRSIMSGKDMSTQLYAVKNGTETAQTEIARTDGKWFLKTSLLLDSTLSLADKGDILSTLSSSETIGNPSFYSFLVHFFTADEGLWKANGIDSAVNAWLEAYVQQPMLISENGESRMKFQYIVPASELLKGIKVAVHHLLSNAELLKKIGTLMTEEQKALLLNPELSWYLDSVIDRIPLTGTAVFERIVTMQGAEVSSHIQIPVYEPKAVWNLLDISSTAGAGTVYQITGNDQRLTWKPDGEKSGIIEYVSGQSQALCVQYDIAVNTETNVDTEDYHHETTTYIMKFSKPDEGESETQWLDFDPIEIQARLHFYSKSAKRSATTLEVTLAGIIPGGRIQAAAKFRTTTPWEFSMLDTSNPILIDSKTSAERIEIGQDIFANLLMSLQQLEPVKEVETPAPTDEPEAVQDEQSAENEVEDDQSEVVRDEPSELVGSDADAAEPVTDEPSEQDESVTEEDDTELDVTQSNQDASDEQGHVQNTDAAGSEKDAESIQVHDIPINDTADEPDEMEDAE